MTPKEQVQEILKEVRRQTDSIAAYNYDMVNIKIAKYIIDEILKSRPSLPKEALGGTINLGECVNLSKKYWDEVKKEVELL